MYVNSYFFVLFLVHHDVHKFNHRCPLQDHHKWKRKGLSLYYACVIENKNRGGSDGSSSQQIVCALRAATENDNSKIFLIDYVYCTPSHRERGIAGKLITNVLQMARKQGATLGVLSIEESCVYWLEKHNFFLCQNTKLNKRLNVFPDTHLLIHKDCNVDSVAAANDNVNSIGNTNSNDDDTTTATAIPPELFISSLKELQIVGTSQSGLSDCFKTLATLINNAKNDDTEDGKRQTIRINNPKVHARVFAVGGDAAMQLLQVCGFELQVNDNGDAVLKFEGEHLAWLDSAVAQLEYEGNK